MAFRHLSDDGEPGSGALHFAADRPFEEIENSLPVFLGDCPARGRV